MRHNGLMLPLHAPKAPGETAWVGWEEDVKLLVRVTAPAIELSSRAHLVFISVYFIHLHVGLLASEAESGQASGKATWTFKSASSTRSGYRSGGARKLPAANLHYVMRAKLPKVGGALAALPQNYRPLILGTSKMTI